MCDLILLEQAVHRNVINLEERLSILILRFTALHFENVALEKKNYNVKEQISVLTDTFEIFRKQCIHQDRDKGRTALDSKHFTPAIELQTEKEKNLQLEAGLRAQVSKNRLGAQVPKKRSGGLGGNSAPFRIATDRALSEVASQDVGTSTSKPRNNLNQQSPYSKRLKTQERTSTG